MPTDGPFDVARVRAAFPALRPSRDAGADADWLFLDNAGGSHVLGAVVERMAAYLIESNVQLGATYPRSVAARERVDAGRAAAAALIGARADTVAFGGSMSELLARLANALAPRPGGAGWLAEGDEVVVTDCDHEANIGPWRRLAERGVVIKEWRVDRGTFGLHLDALESLVTDRTRLVCFTHASNILGRVQPLGEIVPWLHDRGIAACVDGVAWAPHGPIDAIASGVDFYALSFYKVYGPHVAALHVNPRHHERIGRANHDFIGDAFPAKLEPGNVNYEQVASLVALREYVEGLGDGDRVDAFRRIAHHEEALQAPLLEYLGGRRDVRVIGPEDAARDVRVPTVSFVVDGVDSSSVPSALDREGIAIRFGHFYAKRLIDGLGLADRNGVIRVSLVHYNTVEEVHRLVSALDRVLP